MSISKIWVDIESPAGVKQGSGSLLSVQDWRQTKRLDRAGEFAFDMSASDPQAAYLLPKYVVRCYTIWAGVVTEMGAGIVSKVTLTANPAGEPTLHVEGPDLLAELAYRTTGALEMATHNIRAPQLWHYSAGATWHALWTTTTADSAAASTTLTVANSVGFIVDQAIAVALDNGASHVSTVHALTDGTHIEIHDAIPAGRHVATGTRVWKSAAIGYTPNLYGGGGGGGTDPLYVGDPAMFNTVAVDIYGVSPPQSNWTGNSKPTTATFEYWNGAAWATLTAQDSTVCLAHDGIITFMPPADWAATAVNGVNGYWVRLRLSNQTSDVWIAQITVDTYGDDYDTPASILARAPAGWTLAGDPTTVAPTRGWLDGETLLEALVKVAELTGEHFRLGTGRQVVWLNSATTASGIRAVQVSSPYAAESATELALITDLQKTTDSYDLATRVIPYGGGDGDAVLTLASTTRTAPAGYTLSAASNYLKHDATEVTYGQIERVLPRKDISPTIKSVVALTAAANQLYDYAKLQLDLLRSPHYAYSVAITKLDAALAVGTTLQVVYHHWVDSYQAVNIDAALIVLESTATLDAAGLHTVSLVVSDIASWPTGDAEHLVQEIRNTRAYKFHDQMLESALVSSYTEPGDKVLVSDATGSTRWVEAARLAESNNPLAHNILSASHADTTAAAAVRGDLVTGQGASPKWARLALSVPGAGILNYLGINNGETEPSWKAASSNPGAAASLLATAVTTGYVQITGLGVGVAPTAAGVVAIGAAAGVSKDVWLETAGVMRWRVASDSTAETGSNAGSNFQIFRYSDSGAYLGVALSITRATGDAELTRLGIGGAATHTLEVVHADEATGGIRVGAAGFTLVPNPGSVASVLLWNGRGLGFATDAVTLSAAYQPTMGVGLAMNRAAPALGIRNDGGPAISIESGPILMPDLGYIGLGAAAGRIVFDDAATDLLSIMDCQVGIGTTGPAGLLNLAGNTNNVSSYIDGYSTTVGNHSQLIFRKSASNTTGTLTATADTDNIGSLSFQGVNSSSAFAYGAFIKAQQVGASGATYVPAALRFYTSDGTNAIAERLTILPGGNVGIGTAAPATILDVNPNAAAMIGRFASSSATGDSEIRIGNTSLARYWNYAYDHTNHYLAIRHYNAGWAGVAYFTPAGGMVVGAPTGGDKGAGTINAVAVYSNGTQLVSDWIFDLHYDGHVRPEDEERYQDAHLMDIATTERYTKHYRHLPSLPGRAETSKGNYSLGQMIMALWETVERQQLHIYELHGRIAQREAS